MSGSIDTHLAPPRPALYRMIYCSVSTAVIDDATAQGIQHKAQQHNSAVGITGLLLADERLFVQLLEGPRAQVRALFKRIQDDKRHQCVVELMREDDVAERLYPQWSMGFGRASRKELLGVVHEAKRRVDEGLPTPWGAAVGVLTILLDSEMGPAYAQALAVA
jgi:hypothetical protein